MSNRFHSKFHRQNHHTYANEVNPDAGHDPIANKDNPFRGDFILNGAITVNAPLSSVSGYFYSNNTALCAVAATKGAHIYSTGNMGIYVYSAGISLSAYGVSQAANFYSLGNGIDVFGTNNGIRSYSPFNGITSFGGTYGGKFSSTTRAITAFGNGYGIDVASNFYGINSSGGTFGGNFYSTSRGVSAYGGNVGVDVYSPKTGLNVKALSAGLIINSPVLALSSTGGGINVFDGSVGIGTPTPNFKLHVVSSNTGIGTFDAYGTASGITARTALGTIAAPTSILNAQRFAYFVGGSYGTTGFGTNNPAAMSFYSSENHTDTSRGSYIAFDTTTIGQSARIESMTIDSSTTSKLISSINLPSQGGLHGFQIRNNSTSLSAVGGILSNIADPTGIWRHSGAIVFGRDGAWTNTNYPGYVSMWTRPYDSSDQVERIRINSSGNVGINTTTPNEKLTINGNISSNGNVYFSNGNFSGNVTVYGNLSTLGTITQTDTLLFVTSAVSITNTGTGPALTVNQTGNQDIATFFDDSVTSLIIKDGGNVGINTTTPNEKLTINGNVSSNASINCNNLYVNNITASVGNVGVGTITPNEKLTISGSISSTGGFSTSKPLSATGTYTVNSTDYSIILTAATTVTLPTPSQSLGRQLFFKSITTGLITSASTNVVSINGAATNSILPAGPGKWVNLHCDGTYWQIMAGN